MKQDNYPGNAKVHYNCDSIFLKCIQFDEGDTADYVSISKQIFLRNHQKILLFITIEEKTFIKKRCPTSRILSDEYSIKCNVIKETVISRWDTQLRHVCVEVQNYSDGTLLYTLHRNPYHSFALISTLQNNLQEMCIDAALSLLTARRNIAQNDFQQFIAYNAFPLYIIAGNDGWSINYYSI